MKKFTENEIKTSHYAENDILRNSIYEFIEESLIPNIDGIDNTKLTISGKEDLVEELIKIVENSSIDAAIELFKNFKFKNAVINKKKDPLMEAFKTVNESSELERENEEKRLKEYVDLNIDQFEHLKDVGTEEAAIELGNKLYVEFPEIDLDTIWKFSCEFTNYTITVEFGQFN